MGYQNSDIASAKSALRVRFDELPKDQKKAILSAPEIKDLYAQIKNLPAGQKGLFGKEVNQLKDELRDWLNELEGSESKLEPIDITAPFDINVGPSGQPTLLPASSGSLHPVMRELDNILELFARMGFDSIESRELDDDYHMFGSLNFPPEHPARDDYDTFVTTEGLVAPAHTSTMQNRVLRSGKKQLEAGADIRVVIPGRVFRNEDLDARHEHTFYQLEGVCVGPGINAGHLVATIKTWLSNYFKKDVNIKIQPFYFPFTEPSFEFASACVFCDQKGCNICSQTGWIELGGCGMIHPNVLAEAEIDAQKFTGFAWGFGIERLVMLKYGVEDVRHFHSANLRFLEQFK